MTRMLILAGVAFSAALPAAQAMSTVTAADREQAACYGDVQALCGADVPDVDKVTACMLGKRAQVSPGCAKFFPPEKPAG